MASGGSAAQFPASWYRDAPAWLLEAKRDIGIREKLPNGKSNPVVVDWFADCDNGHIKNSLSPARTAFIPCICNTVIVLNAEL